MKNPSLLCRYRSLSGDGIDWVRDSIVNGRHFFASPASFNDPFDCQPKLALPGSKAQLVEYYEYLISRRSPTVGRATRRAEARRRVTDADSNPRLPAVMAGLGRIYHATVSSQVGVLCLSEVCDDILMWSHYGDSHRGVCLMFDRSDLFFATAQPVQYRDERPCVNPILQSEEQMFDAAMLTKSTHWSYEREWRILQYRKGPGVYNVPKASLVQVVLGAKIKPENEKKIRDWISEKGTSVRIVSAGISRDHFAINLNYPNL